MKRKIYRKLLDWKIANSRKPLLLSGVRQVGKSYILERFGAREFPNHYSFNFEKDRKLSTVFEPDLSPRRIISELSIHAGRDIDVDKDFVFFDEIQDCPKAVTSLKYFCEEMPQLALACAGSLLGVKLGAEPFPVGKVDFLNLFPMDFEEFLTALDDEMALELLGSAMALDRQPEVAHDKLWGLLKEYYLTGGMPSAVSEYASCRENLHRATEKVRSIQRGLIDSYSKDFAKHSGKTNSMHIVSVFDNVPMQLSANLEASVKRYRFKGIIPRKKGFTELQGPIQWLEQSGLVIKVKVANRAELPLETFCRPNMFKLFLFDVGLLGCMLDLPPSAIFNADFGIAKGYVAENFAAQEFVSSGVSKLYSWKERNSEIEFMHVIDEEIIPVEVKSGTRTQAKSLGQYIKRYSPSKAIKLTGNPYTKTKGPVLNIPLYAASSLRRAVIK